MYGIMGDIHALTTEYRIVFALIGSMLISVHIVTCSSSLNVY